MRLRSTPIPLAAAARATRAGAGEGGIAVIVPPIGRRGDRVSRVEPAGGRFDGNPASAAFKSQATSPLD